jgi:hypothetical protein
MQAGIHGRYTRFDRNKPRARAIDDQSGAMVMHDDLVRQMEYGGSGLYWTGFWVYRDFADKPNPQNLAPRISNDPKPIPHPRPGT